ncbi:hypothetical protein EDB84DRAFT_1562022 [Lactarius hengduanensis]|nr:hypothetical protein EDB84DRAFT_1562022 [Lactarius hengduanensis]
MASASAQDAENRQMISNSSRLGPPTSRNSKRCNQVAEWQGGSSQLRVEVTVLLARNIPRIKKQFGLKRRFFVSVTSQVTQTTQKTSLVSVPTEGSTAEWNENLDAL